MSEIGTVQVSTYRTSQSPSIFGNISSLTIYQSASCNVILMSVNSKKNAIGHETKHQLVILMSSPSFN